MSDLVESLLNINKHADKIEEKLKAKDKEIERLNHICEYARNEIKDQRAEIERLHESCAEMRDRYSAKCDRIAKLEAVVDRVGHLQGCCPEHTINDCLKYGCDLAALEVDDE